VDVAQELYFKQLYMMSDMLSLTKAKNVHVSFGRMQFADRKMSTRKGNILPLEEVLDEAMERARKLLEEKRSELPETEKKELSETIGIGAVKYAILSQNRSTNITFDWDKIISLEGNSAPYVQYTYARGRSVLGKAISDERSAISTATLDFGLWTLDLPERSLLLHLIAFPEAVERSCEEFKPNLIANYLYALAQKFNHFYNVSPILDAPKDKQELRLKITDAVCNILQLGLNLLGIKVPERM
jgi:arginyl-tRNA synthetase